MVGDVNLFLSEMDDEETEGVESVASLSTRRLQGEIDIMIAEKEFQKRGLGKAATCSMLLYGARRLDIKRFFCKINEDNTPSINLFKKLGFVLIRHQVLERGLQRALHVAPRKVLQGEAASFSLVVIRLRRPWAEAKNGDQQEQRGDGTEHSVHALRGGVREGSCKCGFPR